MLSSFPRRARYAIHCKLSHPSKWRHVAAPQFQVSHSAVTFRTRHLNQHAQVRHHRPIKDSQRTLYMPLTETVTSYIDTPHVCI